MVKKIYSFSTQYANVTDRQTDRQRPDNAIPLAAVVPQNCDFLRISRFILEMIQDRAMADEQDLVCDLLNTDIFNDRERPLIQISMARHYSTFNIQETIQDRHMVCYKGKGKGLDTCYSAAYMSQTRDQQRFTISEVAADWRKLMVLQRIMWPSITRANGQLDSRCSQQTHHRPNRPHQAFTPQPQLLLISRPAEGRRLSWPEHTVG